MQIFFSFPAFLVEKIKTVFANFFPEMAIFRRKRKSISRIEKAEKRRKKVLQYFPEKGRKKRKNSAFSIREMDFRFERFSLDKVGYSGPFWARLSKNRWILWKPFFLGLSKDGLASPDYLWKPFINIFGPVMKAER